MIVNAGYRGKVGAAVPKFTYTGQYNVRKDGVVELLTSGTLVFLNPAVIDIFCVGGGGRGGEVRVSSSEISYLTGYGSGGGGGGYTATLKNVNVANNYQITIGAGSTTNSTSTKSEYGGTTSFGELLSAQGGKSGLVNRTSGAYDTHSSHGNPGGSGGAGGVTSNSDYGTGGSDGANGETGYPINTAYAGGTGQGSTTREFGEATGKLYAGGGGGGRYMQSTTPVISAGGSGGGGAGGWASYNYQKYQKAGAGGANTGGGGGGGVYFFAESGAPISWVAGGSGGSGIVCFRVAK